QQRENGLVARAEEGMPVELAKRCGAQLRLDQVELGEVGVGCLDVLPAIALGPAAFAHPARPGLEPTNTIVDRAGRHTALTFSGDEVVCYGFGEIPDGLDAVLLTESLEHPEHHLVPSAPRLARHAFWPGTRVLVPVARSGSRRRSPRAAAHGRGPS